MYFFSPRPHLHFLSAFIHSEAGIFYENIEETTAFRVQSEKTAYMPEDLLAVVMNVCHSFVRLSDLSLALIVIV